MTRRLAALAAQYVGRTAVLRDPAGVRVVIVRVTSAGMIGRARDGQTYRALLAEHIRSWED